VLLQTLQLQLRGLLLRGGRKRERKKGKRRALDHPKTLVWCPLRFTHRLYGGAEKHGNTFGEQIKMSKLLHIFFGV